MNICDVPSTVQIVLLIAKNIVVRLNLLIALMDGQYLLVGIAPMTTASQGAIYKAGGAGSEDSARSELNISRGIK